jgi:hypothetical protein
MFGTLSEGEQIAVADGTTLIAAQCWCGLWHAIPAPLYRQATHEGHTVYCPLGHSWVKGETKAEKLEKELRAANDRLAAERAAHDQTRTSLRVQKGVTTRIKNRVHKGVCPHCHRYFPNLHAHMTTKHKEMERVNP